MSAVYVEKPTDRLTKKAAQLAAMLQMTYGAGFDSFHAWSDTIKENYLWACADLAEEISALAIQLEADALLGLATKAGSAT
jgi:hypothetical protein